jgi:hypothetical protein
MFQTYSFVYHQRFVSHHDHITFTLTIALLTHNNNTYISTTIVALSPPRHYILTATVLLSPPCHYIVTATVALSPHYHRHNQLITIVIIPSASSPLIGHVAS